MSLLSIETDRQIRLLTEELNDHNRLHPIVVISTHRGRTEPFIDAETLSGELAGMANVYVLATEVWNAYGTAVGGRQNSTYPGGARIYPPGPSWPEANHRLNLQCHSIEDGKRVGGLITERVQALNYGSMATAPLVEPGNWSRCTATVDDALNETQVLLAIDHRTKVVMNAIDLWPGVPASRLVRKGQVLAGQQKSAGSLFGQFRPDPIADDIRARAKATLPDGSVTLARVRAAHPLRAILELHPNFEVTIDADDDDLTLILRVDDITPVEIVWEGDYCVLAFVASEDIVPGLSLIPGGPPWLELRDDQPEGVDVVGQDEATLQDEDLDVDELQTVVAVLKAENAELLERNRALAEENARGRRSLREMQASKRPRVYGDRERQFRFEVELSYLTQFDEDRRNRKPLRSNYTTSDRFLDSVQALCATGGIKREKVVDVCAEVLSDLAAENSSRAVKAWADGKNGPQQMRASDGALAFRVRLQTNTQSARRMKYWRLPDGSMELDWVGVHDDGI